MLKLIKYIVVGILVLFNTAITLGQCDSLSLKNIAEKNISSFIHTPLIHYDSISINNINRSLYADLCTEKDSFLYDIKKVHTAIDYITKDSISRSNIEGLFSYFLLRYYHLLNIHARYTLCSQIIDSYYCHRSAATRLLIKYCVLHSSLEKYQLVKHNGYLCIAAEGRRFYNEYTGLGYDRNLYGIFLERAFSHQDTGIALIPVNISEPSFNKYSASLDVGLKDDIPSYMRNRAGTTTNRTKGLSKNFEYQTADVYVQFYEALPTHAGTEYNITTRAFSAITKKTLLKPLKKQLAKHWTLKKKLEVLHSFVRQTVVGTPDAPLDRTQFAEQTLAYQTGDCEDYAILYASLVHHLLHRKCVFIIFKMRNYENHHAAIGVRWKHAPKSYPRLYLTDSSSNYQKTTSYVIIDPSRRMGMPSYPGYDNTIGDNLIFYRAFHLFGLQWESRAAKRERRREKRTNN